MGSSTGRFMLQSLMTHIRPWMVPVKIGIPLIYLATPIISLMTKPSAWISKKSPRLPGKRDGGNAINNRDTFKLKVSYKRQ